MKIPVGARWGDVLLNVKPMLRWKMKDPRIREEVVPYISQSHSMDSDAG